MTAIDKLHRATFVPIPIQTHLGWAVDPTDLSVSYGWTAQSWIDKSGHRRHTARHLGSSMRLPCV